MTALAESSSQVDEQAVRVRRRESILLILGCLFVLTSAASYSLVEVPDSCAGHCARAVAEHLWSPAVWAATMLVAHWLLNRSQPRRDPLLLPIVGLLTGWGLVLVDRLAPGFLARQTLWVVIGTSAMVVLAAWPRPRPGDPAGLRWLRRYRYTWLVLGLLLLAATLVLGVNPSGTGLRLWLGARLPLLGGAYFQPSELLKLLAVAFLASYMGEKQGLVEIGFIRIGPIKVARAPLGYLAPLFLMWGISLLLLIWQRDLGTATLFFLVFLAMLYLASGRWESIVSGLGLFAGMVVLAYLLPVDQLDVVRLRIDTWLHPWAEAQGRGFQTVQSLLALAAGGVFGKGVGQGFPTYIPVVHSDFAFAAVAEEWGLVGGLSVMACMAVLVQRGLRLALVTPRPFLGLLAAGLAAFLGIQSLIILGGITRLLPLTGVTLPFLSYGGSSLLVSSMMVGLLLKMSSEAHLS